MSDLGFTPKHYDVIRNEGNPVVTWETLQLYEMTIKARLKGKASQTDLTDLLRRVEALEELLDGLAEHLERDAKNLTEVS